MFKKIAIVMTTVLAVGAVFFALSQNNVNAASKPVNYELARAYDQTDAQILEKLKAGWQLGGVYRECGEGFGEISISANVDRALLPAYKMLLDQTKDEMWKLLTKTNTPDAANAIIIKIAEGKERLTKYGTLPDYAKLQDRYDKLINLMAEMGSKIGSTMNSGPSLAELTAKLEKFNQSGTKTEVNEAKTTIALLNKLLDENPEALFDSNKDVDANLEALEKTRTVITAALQKIDKIGTGCRMVYVYYRQTK